MSTLGNFQLDTAPVKPSNHDDFEMRPLHVEQRYCTDYLHVLFSAYSLLRKFHMLQIPMLREHISASGVILQFSELQLLSKPRTIVMM